MTRRAAAVLVLVALACVDGPVRPVFGQTVSGSIRGTVHDVTGAVLVDAVATLTNVDTNRAQTTRTIGDGSFQFLVLPPGAYRLRVAGDGFAPVEFAIEVTVRLEVMLPITLALASPSQTVEVSAPAPVIDRSDTTLSRTFTRAELDALPMLAPRESEALLALAPGVFPAASGQASSVTAAAQPFGSNTSLSDGLSRDNMIGSLSLETAREFRVVANQFGAEFGQASGAIISIVTRSGRNQGSTRIYDFQQNSAMNATSAAVDLVGADEPDSKQASFGGWWGGPLVRDQAFLFASVEPLVRDTAYVNTSPVAAQFRPDDPLTLPVNWRTVKLFARADANLAAPHTLTLRLSAQRGTISNAAREPLSAAERDRNLRNRQENVAVLDTHVFGSAVVNEARAQWARDRFDRGTTCAECATLNYLNILLGKPAGDPQLSINDRVQAADSITWLRQGRDGSHRLKFGIDADIPTLHGAQQTNTVGTYTFSHDLPFVASDRTTYPNRFTRNLGDPRASVRETIVSTFAQDEWRMDTLSLNVGLRWDHTRWPRSDARNDFAPRIGIAFDPWEAGRTVFRASAGRYYDERALSVAKDAEVGFTTMTIRNPGYQGDLRHFDPYGPNPNRAGEAVPAYSFTAYTDTTTPYSDQASVGVQREVVRDLSVSVDLVRALGRDLPIGRDLNYPDPVTHIRPNPEIHQVIATATAAHSWYTGLQIGAQKRLTHGYAYAFAYTLSSSENDTDGPRTFPQDQNLSLDVERGPTSFDSRHRFTATGIVPLPFGGQLSTVMTTRSALPYNVTTGSDDNNDGVINDRPAGEPRNRARGSAFFQTDVRLSKAIRAGHRRLDLMVEVFNVTNQTNWWDYSGRKPGSAGFGLPTTAGPARQIQLGIRFDF
jgi:hypothetical protein